MDEKRRAALDEFRVKSIFEGREGLLRKYKSFMVGDQGWWTLIKFELITTLFGWMPGALGLVLRSFFFPFLFKKIGRKVIFGRDMNIRSPQRVVIGDRVIFGDDVLLDGKGSSGEGIRLGNDVFVGQSSILQTKNGDLIVGDGVNIGYFSTLSSTTRLAIGDRTFIGPYCLAMSGGEHDYTSPHMEPGRSLPLEIGQDCWIAAKAVIFQNCHLGDHSVIGAGAVVTRPIPPNSIAVGSPAQIVKTIPIQKQ
jgi:acetyltransferase-like isoleucine patch superfamily enzyme